MPYKSKLTYKKTFIGTEYQLKKSIWDLFPGTSKADFIYRVNNKSIYLVSQQQPLDVSGLWNIESTLPYNPQVYEGLSLEFIIRMNPVYDRNGDRYSIIEDYIYDLKKAHMSRDKWPNGDMIRHNACSKWFKIQENIRGFKVEEFMVEGHQVNEIFNDRTGSLMKFVVLDIRGVLTVTNPEDFLTTLMKGIGKGRRFGYGMFMVKGV